MLKPFHVSEESINSMITSELENQKVEKVLASVIHEQTFNAKNLTLNRAALVEKIVANKQIKEIETEIIENILKNSIFPNKDKSLIDNHIQINMKNLKNKNNPKTNKPLKNDLESFKLINLLIDEILESQDHLTLENYFGDLANFEADLITSHEKFLELMKKVESFLTNSLLKDEFLTNNIINLFTKVCGASNLQTRTLIDLIITYSNFVLKITDKFFKVAFDISKFYKLSVNFECLNNMIGKLGSDKYSLRKVDNLKIKQMVENYISLLMYNYDEKQQINNLKYGISSNYVIMLLFCLDNDLVNLKILFRNCNTRPHLVAVIDKYKHFVFVEFRRSLSLFCEKTSFIWKHNSVLEQVYPSYKVSKKFLHFAWFYIQINFLGLIVRYKKCRDMFYSLPEIVLNKLNCSQHFENLLSFLLVIHNKSDSSTSNLKELEDNQKESLFYLIKEVCCDFILYCNSPDCLQAKKETTLGLYKNSLKIKNFKYFFEDLLEAFKENVNCDKTDIVLK